MIAVGDALRGTVHSRHGLPDVDVDCVVWLRPCAQIIAQQQRADSLRDRLKTADLPITHCSFGEDAGGNVTCEHVYYNRPECLHFSHGSSIDGDGEGLKQAGISALLDREPLLSFVPRMEAELRKCKMRCALHNSRCASDTRAYQARQRWLEEEQQEPQLERLSRQRPLYVQNVRAKLALGVCQACGWSVSDPSSLDHHPWAADWASDNDEEEEEDVCATPRDDRLFYPYETPEGVAQRLREEVRPAEKALMVSAAVGAVPYPELLPHLRSEKQEVNPLFKVWELENPISRRPKGPSRRPSKEELEALCPGSSWPDKAFFSPSSKRQGQVVNVSSFVHAADSVLATATASQRRKWEPVLNELLIQIQDTRWLLDANCHAVIDKYE